MKNAAILYAREGTLEDRNTLFFLKVLYEFFNTLKDLENWNSGGKNVKIYNTQGGKNVLDSNSLRLIAQANRLNATMLLHFHKN